MWVAPAVRAIGVAVGADWFTLGDLGDDLRKRFQRPNHIGDGRRLHATDMVELHHVRRVRLAAVRARHGL